MSTDEGRRYFYRFKSTAAALDRFHELENQEIYFSPLHELNDPMEGFTELFWQGDNIVWHNLIRHYILILLLTVHCRHAGAGPVDDSALLETFIQSAPSDLPDAGIRRVYEQICNEIFAADKIHTFMQKTPTRQTPVRKYELILYFRILHPIILYAVFNNLKLEHSQFIDKSYDSKAHSDQFILNNEKFCEAIDTLWSKKSRQKAF